MLLNRDRNNLKVTNETGCKILHRLDEWEREQGQLPDFVKLYRELLHIQTEAMSHMALTKRSMDEALVFDRLGEGIPLLLFADFSPDWEHVQTVFQRVAVWATEDSEDQSGGVESLNTIARNKSLLKEVAEGWYQTNALTGIVTEQGIDTVLLASITGATLKPFLFSYSRFLLSQMDQEAWRRRYCPICGGKADFAYLDKESGARWLLCSRCDSEWLFQRLECPYCGTQDQDSLAYFIDEENSDPYRLYVCEQCRTYIKAIDLRRMESDVLLPLERVMAVDMDRQGQEKGYEPGWATLREGSPHP